MPSHNVAGENAGWADANADELTAEGSVDTTEYYLCSCGANVVVSEQLGHQARCAGHLVTNWQGTRL